MSDNNNSDDKQGTRPTVNSGGANTLSLKRPSLEQSRVKQSLAHGRGKTVVVETKRKRFGDDRPAGAPAVEERSKFVAQPRVADTPAPRPAAPLPPRPGVVLRTLSADEREARERALADSRVREAQERKRQEEDGARRKIQEAHDAVEREAAAKRKAEDDAR
ncbi:MAG: translation initiation factor IF-2 associated domain-containing protein, partial [Aestuariivirga sp.]